MTVNGVVALHKVHHFLPLNVNIHGDDAVVSLVCLWAPDDANSKVGVHR
jgi:hypothetical protein